MVPRRSQDLCIYPRTGLQEEMHAPHRVGMDGAISSALEAKIDAFLAEKTSSVRAIAILLIAGLLASMPTITKKFEEQARKRVTPERVETRTMFP